MDTLTHALSGALLARATASKDASPHSLPRRIAAGFFACAAPDLDFVLSYVGPVEYLLHHRGFTHSIILLPLWALGLSWVLAKVLREPRGWRALYGVTALAVAAHIVGDLITSFGTIIFAPFSNWRAAIGTTFIIDLCFSGIIVAGLLLSVAFWRSRWPAITASTVLVAYVGFQYMQKQNAINFGEQYALEQSLSEVKVTAYPRPPTAFNWTVFVSDDEVHRYAHINLIRREPRRYQPGDGFIARIDSPYLPLDQAAWTTKTRYGQLPVDGLGKEAWNAPALAFFRWFADVPAFDGVTESSTCVWFADLRFMTPGRDTMPFRFGACRETAGGSWRAFERESDEQRTPVR